MAATICPRPTLTYDLLTLTSVWQSHVTWGTPVQSFVFLGIMVFELEPMYATSDRRTTDADHHIIIQMLMFMVLSSWQSHCESSPG